MRSERHEIEAQRYLDRVGDRYVFDGSGPLYQEKSDQPAKESIDSQQFVKSFRWGKFLRQWLPIVISGLTLFFLVWTVRYAQLQWKEARRTATASINAAYEACRGSQISRAALIQSIETGRDTHDASVASTYESIVATQSEGAHVVLYVTPGIVITVGQQIVFNVGVKNEGKTAGSNIVVKARAVLVPRTEDPAFVYPEGEITSIKTPRLEAGHQPNDSNGPNIAVPVRDGKRFHIGTARDNGDIMAGQKDVLLFARVTYDDSLGVHHWLDFCRTVPPMNGDTPGTHHEKCIYYNKEDRNNAVSKSKPLSLTSLNIPEITCTVPNEQ
jgi:hypothetical protein